MKISTARAFRALTLAAALLHLFLWLAPVLGPGRLAGFDVWLLNFDGYGASIGYSPVLYWCLFASWMLAYAGLFFYVGAARGVLIALTVITLGLVPAWGIRVLTPWEAAAGSLLAFVDGIVIAMAYLPPVRREFARRR